MTSSEEVYGALEQLKGLPLGGIFEAYEVTRISGYRTAENGSYRDVEIEILDAGPKVLNRYHITATSRDGDTGEEIRITGNPMSDLETALGLVHWYEWD